MESAFEEKPSLSDLAHYGVLGMKWGKRQKATSGDIHEARKNLRGKAAAYRKESKKLDNKSLSPEKRKALESKLQEMHKAYLKDPDRVIAARMSRGEKIGSAMMSSSGLGILPTLASITGTSLASRRIEYKQDKGAYDNFKDKKVQKRIGFQRGRTAVLLGATVGPMVLQTVGPIAVGSISSKIATKAATNRKAAQYASRAPKGISAVASKIKYAKPSRGAYKITTMK